MAGQNITLKVEGKLLSMEIDAAFEPFFRQAADVLHQNIREFKQKTMMKDSEKAYAYVAVSLLAEQLRQFHTLEYRHQSLLKDIEHIEGVLDQQIGV